MRRRQPPLVRGLDLDEVVRRLPSKVERWQAVRSLVPPVAPAENTCLRLARFCTTKIDKIDEEEEEDELKTKAGFACIIIAARRRQIHTSKVVEGWRAGGPETVARLSLRSLERAGCDCVVVVASARYAEISAEYRAYPGRLRPILVELKSDSWKTKCDVILAGRRELLRLGRGDEGCLIMPSNGVYDDSFIKALAPRSLEDRAESDDEYDCALLVDDHFNENDLPPPPGALLVKTVAKRRALDLDIEEGAPSRPSLQRQSSDFDSMYSDYANSSGASSFTSARRRLSWCLRVGTKKSLQGDDDCIETGLLRVEGTRFFEACRKKRTTLADALDTMARADSLQAIYADGADWLRLNENSASPASNQEATSSLAKFYQSTTSTTPDARFAVSAMTSSDTEYTEKTSVFTHLRQSSQQHVLVPSLSKFGKGTSFAVSIQDGTLALVSEREAQAARAITKPSLLVAACGVADLSLLSHLGLRYHDQRWELLVLSRVPLMGWCVLILSVSAVATGFAVTAIVDRRTPLESLYSTPHLLALLVWRSAAATLMAAPILIYRLRRSRHIRRQYQQDISDNHIDEKATRKLSIFFFGKVFQQPALWLTISTAWLGSTSSMFSYRFCKGSDVYLIWNLVPVAVVLFRWCRLMNGTPVQPLELAGAALGILGATCCAAAAPSSAFVLTAYNPFLGLGLALIGVIGRAANGVAASRLVSEENEKDSTAAPLTVHLITQMSCCFLWLCCLVTVDSEGHFIGFDMSRLGFDRLFGAFAFLLPSFDRLPCYLYLSIVADTLGTLGSLVALRHLDPLLVSVATLFTPGISVLSLATLHIAPCPGLGYFVGIGILAFGAALLVAPAAKSHTALVDIDHAIVPLNKGKPGTKASRPETSPKSTVAKHLLDDDPRLNHLVAESLYNQLDVVDLDQRRYPSARPLR